MKQIIIVKTGEDYSSDQFCFDKETDALEFFKSIGKAKKLTRYYISGGVGTVYTESADTTTASVTYGAFATKEELEYLKAEELEKMKEAAKVEEEEANEEPFSNE